MSCIPSSTGAHGREILDVTIKQTVHTHRFVIVIQKATRFGCTRQPSSGFMFEKYRKEVHVAAAIHTTLKTWVEMSPLQKILVNVTFRKQFNNM